MRTVHNPPRRLPNGDFRKISQDARKFDAMAIFREKGEKRGMRTVHNPPWRLPNVDFRKISQDARKFGRNGAMSQ